MYCIFFSITLRAFAEQTGLSVILPIVKSCNVKLLVAGPSCSVKTAATECCPRLSCSVITAVI